ncbi:unnamed protein product [Prorocentrum cordatum]|uniref:Uncharacterized protein n=1 Tax=Prorocentrum cordatum TaxID=2364126 RepID=A0ABN9TCA2_9DINO|nr:unnamed protein product [Polarella glacialis]
MEAAMLPAGWPAPLEIEPGTPPAEPDGGTARAALPAAALLVAVVALCATSEEVGRRCTAGRVAARGSSAGCVEWRCVWNPAGCSLEASCVWVHYVEMAWRQTALWSPLVALPYAALAVWCVWRRGSFRADLPLHQWTQRYGVGACVLAALYASLPWYEGCPLSNKKGTFLDAPLLVSQCVLMVFSQIQLAYKLDDLDCRRLGRAVRLTAVAAVMVIFLSFAVLLPAVYLGVSDDAIDNITILGLRPSTICGLWGMVGAAGRVALSGAGLRRRAACFVLLTAACLALSLGSMLAVVYTGVAVSSTYRGGLRALQLVPRGTLAGFTHWVSAADALLNCLTAAAFSGLAGPRSLQVLALDAFSVFYEKYLEYLSKVPGYQAIVGSSGFPLLRDGPKHRFVLSHPWLSSEHPDPTGAKLRLLVNQLDMLQASDADAVFILLPALAPARQAEPGAAAAGAGATDARARPAPGSPYGGRGEAQFKEALSSMEEIYSVGRTPVIVLPMEDLVETGREYISRGWCFLEFCLAMSFDNIANAEVHEPVRRLIGDVKNMKGDTVHGFREAFKTTHFTSKGDADVVLRLFENTLSLGSTR